MGVLIYAKLYQCDACGNTATISAPTTSNEPANPPDGWITYWSQGSVGLWFQIRDVVGREYGVFCKYCATTKTIQRLITDIAGRNG